METISSFRVELAVQDGTTMSAFVARPTETTPSRGILLLQEAFGVNAHIRDVSERLAREGLLVIAPELFHRIAPGFEGSYTEVEIACVHLAKLTDPELIQDLQAAFHWIQTEGGLAMQPVHAVGFCMGGRTAFLANTVLPLTSAVSFYGGNISNLLERVDQLHGPMLFFWGGQDAHISREQRTLVLDALDEAQKPYLNTVFSTAGHGFFCNARASYHAKASTLAWPLMLGFLKQE